MFARFNNLRIAAKLWLGFGTMAVLMFVTVAYVLVTLNNVGKGEVETYNRETVPLAYLVDVATNYKEARSVLSDAVALQVIGESARAMEIYDKIPPLLDSTKKYADLYEQQIVTDLTH